MKLVALDWIERFSRHVTVERRLSPHTHSSYRLDLASLVAYCDRSGVEDWSGLDVRHVRAFAAQSHAGGLAPPSVQRRLSAVRTFQKFLMREGVLNYNSAQDVSAPRSGRPLPKVLNVDEMTRLIEGPKATGCYFLRDRAIMELFYSSGLRLAELTGLNVSDLDFHDRTVRVLGKGSRERIVPVGRMALAALKSYLAERKRRGRPVETALFVGRNGRRLVGRAVQFRVALWAKRAGIQQQVNPHMFRHSCATHLLEFLGHASISTTAIYTHLNFQHLAKVYMATHPRANTVDPEAGVTTPKPHRFLRDHSMTRLEEHP
jgi:integrase/recombinase XerC